MEEGIIKIIFVKSSENDSNIFTKIVIQETYEKITVDANFSIERVLEISLTHIKDLIYLFRLSIRDIRKFEIE